MKPKRKYRRGSKHLAIHRRKNIAPHLQKYADWAMGWSYDTGHMTPRFVSTH